MLKRMPIFLGSLRRLATCPPPTPRHFPTLFRLVQSCPLSSMASSSTQDEVIFEQRASVALAKLNRPQALNSLNLNMVQLLLNKYEHWDRSESVHCIVLRGTGNKAFCAGGDVKQIALMSRDGRMTEALRAEYRLNSAISQLQKPHIALIDGITMGGGAGVSMHGTFRVATERTGFAMPECGIGLFPDVGACYFLSRLPGQLGTYLALTGARLNGADVKHAGLATHYVPSKSIDRLQSDLASLGPRARSPEAVDATIQLLEEQDQHQSSFQQHLPNIDACFSGRTVEEIQASLAAHATPFAAEALAMITKGSPLSQKVTLRAVREAQGMCLAEVLNTDNRLVTHMVMGPSDFYEGVRATLIDKDGKPHWNPAQLTQVDDATILRFFEPLSQADELKFASSTRSRL